MVMHVIFHRVVLSSKIRGCTLCPTHHWDFVFTLTKRNQSALDNICCQCHWCEKNKTSSLLSSTSIYRPLFNKELKQAHVDNDMCVGNNMKSRKHNFAFHRFVLTTKFEILRGKCVLSVNVTLVSINMICKER